MSEKIILPVLSLGGVRLEPLDVHHETGLREAVCARRFAMGKFGSWE